MIYPNMESVKNLCGRYTVAPLCLELFSDVTTPIRVLKRLKERERPCYLLESVEGGEKWGRYSFLGLDPKKEILCKDGNVTVRTGVLEETRSGKPGEAVRELLEAYRSPALEGMPPFTGGLVGYFAYDYVKYTSIASGWENLKNDGFDDLHLMLFDKIIAFDHLRQKIILIVNIFLDDIENNYVDGVIALKEMETLILSTGSERAYPSRLLSAFSPMFSEEAYGSMVEKVKEEIIQGNVFQVVLANRMEALFEGDLVSAYRVLRTLNPSPYMFYLDFGTIQVAGASPETLVSLKEGVLSVFPIAGTCRRGKDAEEDEALISRLLNDEKELAEHAMLVDLGRNDLGKISEFQSIRVQEYMRIHKFSHVSHITSTVTGKLRQGLDPLDAIDAVLPAGTLSGAPKDRAVGMINEIEGIKRGVYGGAIGYIGFSGNMDVCIAIRMAVKLGDRVKVAAGAGIVADSDPQSEYMECLNKARAMITALENAQEVE